MKRALLVIITILIATGACSKEIESEILYFESGRIYFPYGEADNLYDDCPFTLYYNNDSVYFGYIDHALQSVSESERIEIEIDSLSVDKYKAVLIAADLDSTTAIKFGICDSDPFFGSSDLDQFLEEAAIFKTRYGNRISFLIYDDESNLGYALERGNVDGIFSLRNVLHENIRYAHLEYPLSAVATLVPNLRKPINRNGILTTSLYYFFNPSQFVSFYNGGKIVPYNGLLYRDKSEPRKYNYHPEKGKRLLDINHDEIDKLSIATDNPWLSDLRDYYYDILSRNRFAIDPNNPDPYASLVFYHLSQTPLIPDALASIWRTLDDQVKEERDKYRAVDEKLKIVKNYLNEIATADNVESAERYRQKAEKSLIEDLGVYPLFRPVLNFAYNKKIKNVSLNSDGLLDLENLKLIKMPDNARQPKDGGVR